jgi:hypothetical protein
LISPVKRGSPSAVSLSAIAASSLDEASSAVAIEYHRTRFARSAGPDCKRRMCVRADYIHIGRGRFRNRLANGLAGARIDALYTHFACLFNCSSALACHSVNERRPIQ